MSLHPPNFRDRRVGEAVKSVCHDNGSSCLFRPADLRRRWSRVLTLRAGLRVQCMPPRSEFSGDHSAPHRTSGESCTKFPPFPHVYPPGNPCIYRLSPVCSTSLSAGSCTINFSPSGAAESCTSRSHVLFSSAIPRGGEDRCGGRSHAHLFCCDAL
ncbi:hypothetical protein B0H11DRAFT_2095971 [Mycena galericulata]|nr:hypothetical protein B0H11DRAFT_2095971 [Mycena galericulata]